ncbi:hypothetical protein AN477_18510 [Alicyclobacillus ferrooxydans]|uniref:Uncharacterized protein n=1 Tax=Alicyclobacillus ferrooxydans TaxID=471514 RepID=A0A0P9CAB9_9BACL|nr:hypothetical protein AN477_18510 [Alicyclobacillus ferrooxydans]
MKQSAIVESQVRAIARYHAHRIQPCLDFYESHGVIRGRGTLFRQEFEHNLRVKEQLSEIVRDVIDPTDDHLQTIILESKDLLDEFTVLWRSEVSRQLQFTWRFDLKYAYRIWTNLAELLDSDEDVVTLVDKAELLAALRRANDPKLWARCSHIEFPNVFADTSLVERSFIGAEGCLIQNVSVGTHHIPRIHNETVDYLIKRLGTVIETEMATLQGDPIDVYEMGFLAGIERSRNEALALLAPVKTLRDVVKDRARSPVLTLNTEVP